MLHSPPGAHTCPAQSVGALTPMEKIKPHRTHEPEDKFSLPLCTHVHVGSVMSNSLQPHGCKAPLSVGFSRQEYWSGLLLPVPGDLPDTGIEPVSLESPALARGFFYHCATFEVPPFLCFGAVTLKHLVLQLEGTWPHMTSTHSVEADGPYILDGSPSFATSHLFPCSLGV